MNQQEKIFALIAISILALYVIYACIKAYRNLRKNTQKNVIVDGTIIEKAHTTHIQNQMNDALEEYPPYNTS